MSMRLLAVLLVFSQLLQTAAGAGTQGVGVRRALLIGINEYQTDEFFDLRGAVNDVRTMQEILTSRFGFAPGNITTLTDADATRARIMAAFDQLVSRSGPDDIVYVHYSGHGSQLQDLNGDERDDGTDETILPYNARMDGVADITDDELGEFLRALPARTAVIVLDSCHSGTATRGGARNRVLTRSVPADTRLDLYRRPADQAATRALVELDIPEQYVLLGGAAANQNALDGPVAGKYHGFFSYALAQALSTPDAAISPRELQQRVTKTYQVLSEAFGGMALPEPQIEASAQLLDAPLFPNSSGGKTNRPFLQVLRENAARIRLVRGMALNALVGSYWAIYPSGETTFSPANSLGSARVVAIRDLDSIATMEPANLDLDSGAIAVALAAAPDLSIPTARWDRVDDPAQRAKLEDRIKGYLPELEFVAADEFARFVLDLQGGSIKVSDAAGLTVVDEFPLTSTKKSAQRLVRLFSRSVKATSLTALTNAAARLRIDARVVGGEADGTKRVRAETSPRSHDNSLMLEVSVSADSYITIVDVDPEGGINLLFPNDYTDEGFIPAGRVQAGARVRIPDSLESDNEAGFFWDYHPPVGTDTIQVFASADLATAQLIRDWIVGLTGVSTRGLPATQANGLDELRTELIEQVSLRGIKVVANKPAATASPTPTTAESTQDADWNSVSLRVRVVD